VTIAKKAVLVGLIGTKLQFSRAPEIHMQEGELSGIRYIYRLVDMAALGLGINDIPALLVSAQQLGFNGLSVTHPFKESIIPHLTELSDDAARLGAVNTVIFRKGSSIGHNTDWFGFAASFRRDMAHVKTDRVIQLGAGGAGKAVAHGLLSCGVKHVALSVRNPDKVRPIVEFLASRHGASRISIVDNLAEEIAAADGIVNATPIGMDAYPGSPLAASFLRRDLWVVDIIYSPSETEFLKSARAVGARASNGTGMFVFQAAEQFRLFSGTQPNVERMEDHIARILATRNS
jgi:shikimate dehydrogenase